MSLLDDVSIVVTPNGYKAGTLFGVIPVPTEGAELVTNGDFATDSDWNLDSSFSISGGLLTQNGTAGRTFQSISALETGLGTYIKVTFTVEAISSGQFHISCYGVSSPVVTTTGTYTFTGVTSDTTNLYVNNGGYYANGSISNISVKTFLSADMDVTRATDATRVNESGLIEDVLANVPRIDYTGGGCPHILAEPQRTNLVTYSQVYGSGTFFNATSGSVIDNTTSTSPSGDANATQVTSTGAGKIQSGGLGLTQNTDYTLSFYAKNVDATAVTSRVLALGGSGGSNLTSVSYISELSTTEWTKITHSFNTGTNTTIYVYISNVLNSGGTIQLWGAQLEEGSYATSYIPTSGSTVTRNQDIFTRDGIGSLINSTEGVLFFEGNSVIDTGIRFISISDGTSLERMGFYFLGANCYVYYITGGVVQIERGFAVDNTTTYKVALRYSATAFSMYVNGTEILTSVSGSVAVPNTFNVLKFANYSTTNHFYGKVKQLQVYKTALTDVQLAALTS